ncbi:MAG: hypothetical protein NC548_33995 [Lachnospiraceae bacterium]|nr:hypothetical protein [Lachnospiraceae bacterium]
MPKRIAVSTLNASTVDILNVIRSNATAEYQQLVPEVTKSTDIPKVGEILVGYPAMANQFLNSLLNRIAKVVIDSMVFNNPYSRLKKGYLEFGETVEHIFVGLVNALPYNAEKANEREFKRYLPDVRSAFYVMNWRVLYPITIQNTDLKLAFTSVEGVRDMIARLVDSVYKSAEVDEFLLFKYMMIKAISHGKMYPVAVDTSEITNSAVAFRGISNTITFPKTSYNESGVLNTTPRSRQIIFMDAMYNARFDVNVLASAFNMDKATFIGSLYLIDDWDTFDSTRFTAIMEQSDGFEPVTADELALLKDVHAVIVDEDWFQVYDNETQFREKYVASTDYWNYFYHTWKTIAHSPFHNAVCFVDSTAEITAPASVTAEVMSKSISAESVSLAVQPQFDTASLANTNGKWVQTSAMTEAGIGITPDGALLIPASQAASEITLVYTLSGQNYTAGSAVTSAANVGDTVTLTPGGNS